MLDYFACVSYRGILLAEIWVLLVGLSNAFFLLIRSSCSAINLVQVILCVDMDESNGTRNTNYEMII